MWIIFTLLLSKGRVYICMQHNGSSITVTMKENNIVYVPSPSVISARSKMKEYRILDYNCHDMHAINLLKNYNLFVMVLCCSFNCYSLLILNIIWHPIEP